MPRPALALSAGLALALLAAGCEGPPPTGHPTFASPHADPIALSPRGDEVYAVNTPADTLDVISVEEDAVVARIPVGIDPVSVAVRPDGLEAWVSNHVSDTVSVIDTDPSSPTRHHVIATITAWDASGTVTDFDEPVGIAFADDTKAYVALSSRNFVAVVDVASRSVTKQLSIRAQEPRAIAVRDGRLYVIPFESMNQTEISGCADATAPGCTFSLLELLSNSNDIILTRNLEANIVRKPETPDRDLFVFDTADESPLFEVSTLGTLLYGLAVDSGGRVFVAMTEARNDANGLMADGDDLPELENRAFLNQVVRVDCSVDCSDRLWVDLEPPPPANPAPGEALATPFGIQVSADDDTVVAVAAGSNKLFSLDADTGAILASIPVGAIPRGLALESDAAGRPLRAWVHNTLENSVSRVGFEGPDFMVEVQRIPLEDPTHPEVKQGRIAFNDAAGSTTGTFSCGSCHPDGNTDQLLWNLGAKCITPGCDQVQPRTTMPIRGLRGTLPLHWDGVPGDPFGGINAEVADSGIVVAPNCSDEHSCFRNLVDGAMSGTMCLQGSCPSDENELGLAGAFDESQRDAMAVFLRSVPYPTGKSRPVDDRLSPLAAEGLRNFVIGIDPSRPGCSRAGACHAMPFWAGTNTPGTGFDAPTFRGIPDRHLLLPNGRAGMWDLIRVVLFNEVPWDPTDGPDELYSWGMTFGTDQFPFTNRNSSGTGPFQLFQWFDEASMGFSSSFGRQVTLDAATTAPGALAATLALLERLEQADAQGVVDLRAHGLWQPDAAVEGESVRLVFESGQYLSADSGSDFGSRGTSTLIEDAQAGALVLTVTARLGIRSDVDHPQPELSLPSSNPTHPAADFLVAATPVLDAGPTLTVFGKFVDPDPIVLVDGQAVDAAVGCELGGSFPACTDDFLRVDLAVLPAPGDHTFQLANREGLQSNEILIVVP